MILPGPQRVLETLERVRREHPYGASGQITRCERTETDALAVWARLLSEDAGSALDDTIRELSPLEERLAIFGAPGRVGEPAALCVLSRLFALRRPTRATSLAWDCYLISNGDPAFAEQALAFATSSKGRRSWPEIARSPVPLDQVARLYGNSSETFARWIAREDIGLGERENLVRSIKRTLLSRRYVAPTRQREKSSTLKTWIDECYVDSERVAWFANYLFDTHRSSWRVDDPFLQLIIARFEVPKRGRPFWDGLSKAVIDAVDMWLRNVELTRLLGDNEGPRIQFWREFLPSMVGSLKSPDGRAVFICFDNWFAVQFRDMGKATYMFAGRRLRQMQGLYESRLYAVVREGNHIGRYAHQGQWWQDSARGEVSRVLREHSR